MQNVPNSSKFLKVLLISTIVAFSGLLMGYDAGIIAVSKDQVTQLFALSDNQWSLIAGSSILGSLFGLFLTSKLNPQLGQKTMLIVVAIGFMSGIILTASAAGMAQFLIGRFIVGVSIGIGCCTAPLFISEIAPVKIRGALILINSLAITGGQALSFLAGYFLHDISLQSWRFIIGIGFVPALFLLIGMLFTPQSPRWVAMKYGIDQARSILTLLRNNAILVEEELAEIDNAIRLKSEKASFKQLFRKPLLAVTVIGIFLGVFQQLVGISTIMYYGPVIFSAAGFYPIKNAILATFALGIVNLIATLITMFTIDYYGRRRLLLFGTLMAGISLICVGYINAAHNKWVTFFFFSTYIIGYCISLGSIFWVIIAEIYPLKFRSLAMSVASASETSASLLVTITFLQIMHLGGLTGTFWLYSGICFISFVFIYLFVPETKGISLEQIEKNLNLGVPIRKLGQIING